MDAKVYLVGAGPGDPGFITVKGRQILSRADVVIYDYLVDRRLLESARPEAELVCCSGFGKNQHDKINSFMLKKVKQGKKVIRLKAGDPFVFGRASEEMEALIKNKIAYEVVPGITAAAAASSLSGIPLTDRKLASSCVFVTGCEDSLKKENFIDWDKIAASGTIILYMAMEVLPEITRRLLEAGKNPKTPVVIMRDVSFLTQKALNTTLKDAAREAKKNRIKPPAVIIIGETAGLRKRFDWLKKSKKALFTGLSEERFFQKEMFFHLPLIKITALKDYSAFDKALKNISSYDWLVFSSRYGVEYFFQRLKAIGYDARKFSWAKIAAIGNSTKNKLSNFGLIADLVPKDESSKGLIKAFKKIDLKGRNIFIPRSDLSDKGLTEGLKNLGAEVTACVAYKNIMPECLPEVDFSFFDEIYFSSPSGVRNFIKRYGRPPKTIKVRCIGDVTKKEAKKWGLPD